MIYFHRFRITFIDVFVNVVIFTFVGARCDPFIYSITHHDPSPSFFTSMLGSRLS